MISDMMNFSESSCSSFSLTDSESELENRAQNDCDQKADENHDDKKEVIDSGGGSLVEKEEIKKTANSTEENKKEEINASEKSKEKIVYR